MKNRGIKTIFFRTGVFLFAVFCAAPCPGKEIFAQGFGYYLDIPEDWQILNAANPALVSFTDPGRRAVFQVTVFSADAYARAREVQAYYKARIKAEGEEADFVYQGQSAVIADYRFNPGGYLARGWFIFLSAGKNHFALSAFCEASAFEAFNDALLSCMDSFAPGENERLYPGPVSQFYHAFSPEKNGSSARIRFGEDSFSLAFSPQEVEANTVIIERESRLLAAAAGGENQNAAWRRYYRLIFRDSYMRLLPVARGLEPFLRKRRDGQALPAAVLGWFQEFSSAGRIVLRIFSRLWTAC
jgi:hypothetical protein